MSESELFYQEILDNLKHSETEGERLTALSELSTLEDQDVIDAATELAEDFVLELDEKQRGWMISGFAALRKKSKIIQTHIDPAHEPSANVRFWATVGLPKVLQGRKLRTALAHAASDPEKRVRAVALRLLVEIGYEREYADSFKELLESNHLEQRLAACNALLSKASPTGVISSRLRNHFGEILRNHILNRTEELKCRQKALLALADLTEEPNNLLPLVLKILQDVEQPLGLKLETLKIVASSKIRVQKEDLLSQILASSSVEYKREATKTLMSVWEQDEIVEMIVDQILNEDSSPKSLIEVLREVNYIKSARLLSKYLYSEDRAIAEKAFQALLELGGEATALTYHTQREKRITNYEQLVTKIDTEIMEQFQRSIREARLTLMGSVLAQTFFFIVPLGMIIFGLRNVFIYDVTDVREWVALGISIAGVLMLIIWSFRNPLKIVRQSMVDLGKINVIFMGYIRQMGQIDLAFKQSFLDTEGYDPESIANSLAQIQNSVERSMDEVSKLLDELGELLQA